jgi:hypothetical protein
MKTNYRERRNNGELRDDNKLIGEWDCMVDPYK